MIENRLQKLQKQISVLKGEIPNVNVYALEVSTWSVGDHIEHLLRAHLVILRRLDANLDKRPEVGKKLNIFGRLILLFGKIPRGVGNAPNLTTPRGCSEDKLKEYLAEFEVTLNHFKEKIPALELSKYTFPHPALGVMTLKQWLRFIEVHTWHHLRIIRSIKAVANK